MSDVGCCMPDFNKLDAGSRKSDVNSTDVKCLFEYISSKKATWVVITLPKLLTTLY